MPLCCRLVRPMPSRVIRASFLPTSGIDRSPEVTLLLSGRALPGTMSIKIVLPAPFGPMAAR